MTTCSKCKCEAKYCGCADRAQPVAPPCEQGTSDCPMPESCAEIFSAECVIYNGDDMPEYGIKKGDRLDDIIQRMVLYQFNYACIQPYSGTFPGTAATCGSVTGLRSDFITANEVKLLWTANILANSYTVEYKKPADASWTVLYAFTTPPNQYTVNGTYNTYYTVGNLNSNTTYWFRVASNCTTGGPCYSVIIELKTTV
jgi:hypothetical protein